MGECTQFARRTGYKSIVLWTNSVLASARKIYEAEGYRLVKEEPHHSFGRDLVGQFWELGLVTVAPTTPPTCGAGPVCSCGPRHP